MITLLKAEVVMAPVKATNKSSLGMAAAKPSVKGNAKNFDITKNIKLLSSNETQAIYLATYSYQYTYNI